MNSHLDHHACNEICKVCKQRDCKKTAFIKCDWCKTKCQNQNCLTFHQIKCKNQKKCVECGRYEKKNHICNGRYCYNCKIFVNSEQQCYILTHEEKLANTKSAKKDTFAGYIFFDYECMIETQHIPNLIVSKKYCKKCIDTWTTGSRLSDCTGDCGVKNLLIIILSAYGFLNKWIGPKNYAFLKKNKETVGEVKGFSLNYKASLKVSGRKLMLS